MKNMITKTLQMIALTVLSLAAIAPLNVHAAANSVLSASSATANKGSSVTITVSLNTSGAQVFGYQADLNYSTTYFSSASIAMASGTPFTATPGSTDPDVASGGNIHFTRFNTSLSAHNGSVATITLQSNGTVGTSSISFKSICPNTTTTTNCSAVFDASNSQLLGSTNNGTINIIQPPAATGGSASSASGGSKAKTSTKAKTSGGSTVAAASTTPAATTTTTEPTTKSTKTETKETTHKVVLTIVDQNGKPIQNAKLTLDGISGTTDRNGKVTIGGLDAGTAQGLVYYKGKSIPIKVKIGSANSVQSSKVSINIKKSNVVVPIAVGAVVVMLAVAAFLLLNGKGAGGLKFRTHHKQAVLSDSVIKVAEKVEKPKPAVPEPVKQASESPRPQQPAEQSAASLHEKAVDPGTVFTPHKSI